MSKISYILPILSKISEYFQKKIKNSKICSLGVFRNYLTPFKVRLNLTFAPRQCQDGEKQRQAKVRGRRKYSFPSKNHLWSVTRFILYMHFFFYKQLHRAKNCLIFTTIFALKVAQQLLRKFSTIVGQQSSYHKVKRGPLMVYG